MVNNVEFAGVYAQEVDKSDEHGIVGDNLCKLWEVPAIPFLDSHTECVDVLVEKLKQCTALNDVLILTVDIGGDSLS